MKGYLLIKKINIWVYKEPYKFPVTIEGTIKIFDVTPHQNEVEISITIEEIKKVKEISPKRYTNAL